MTSAAYDNVADGYDAWVGRRLSDPTLDVLVGDVRGQRVGVLACGQGRDARYVAGRGGRAVGIDISAGLLAIGAQEEAAAHTGVRYLRASAMEVPLAGGSLDGVLCHMALMDIPGLDEVAAGVARILRAGGWFVFSITHPCFKSPATGELTDHVDGSVRRVVGRYFDEGYWPGPGARAATLPIGAYHRTLSSYMNSLARAGLVIERMIEPAGTPDAPVWYQVPCLLYARCRLDRSPQRRQ